MSEVLAQNDPAAAVSTAVPQVVTRVHKIDSVSERTFWIGHFAFSILAVVGVALIIWARGPRRRDALLSSSAGDGKE